MVIPPAAIAKAKEKAEEAAAQATESRIAAGRTPEQMNLGLPIKVAIFLVVTTAALLGGYTLLVADAPVAAAAVVLMGVCLATLLVRVVHVAAQWERGVVLRVGTLHRVRGPGLVLILPVVEYLRLLDTRVQTVEIPQQRVITRDNIPISIDGVLYFRVVDAASAFTKVQDFMHAILQYAQATLRDVVGRMTLDEMLAEREQIEREIEAAVGKHVADWGLEVDALRLLDVDMPEELKRMMSRQASAEREKRATITKAEGDKLAAVNLAEAAATMLQSPGAMQLRTLQTLDGLGSSSSNTVVLAVPTEMLELARRAIPAPGGAPDAGASPPAGRSLEGGIPA